MARDFRVEGWLSREGVEWEYVEDVPLKRIDRDTSLSNQARMDGVKGGLRESLVESYAVAMGEGAEFPALIVYEFGGRYILISGNHRAEAARQVGRAAFDVYLVKSDDLAVLGRLTRTANLAIEGDRGTEHEAIAHARWLVKKNNFTIKDAAAAVHMTPDRLYGALRRIEVEERVRPEHAEHARKLAPTALIGLGTIDNGPAFNAALDLAGKARITAAQADALAKEVRAVHSEAEQLAVVEDWAQRPDIKKQVASTRGGTARRAPDYAADYFRYAHALTNLLRKHPSLTQLGISDPAEITRAWETRGKLLIALEGPFGRDSAQVRTA